MKNFTIIPSEGDVEAGIYIWYDCVSCTISDNIIANFSETISYERNWYGIRLDGSNCAIQRNTFINDGLLVNTYFKNAVKDNTVNGKPLIYLEDTSGYVISNAGQVILLNCSNIGIENLDLSSTTIGVELIDTHNTRIIGNNITTNSYCGIGFYSSSKNIITRNDISENMYGILLGQSSDNKISENNIAANKYYGSYLYAMSTNNVFSGNNITNNMFGIACYDSTNNKFYHNNFLENIYTHADPYNYAQVWDNGYPSGGNHWDSYTGIDGNGDGIGDTPYIIDGVNQDNYPLINLYIPGDINHDGIVNINDAALVGLYWMQAVPPAPIHVDLNEDGIINIYDAAIIGTNWFRHV